MFNMHSTEILLILVVALIVIGPERLPAAIKTAGLWMGRFRRSFYKVKAEIERELNTDEIRRQLHNESVIEEVEKAKSRVEEIAKETETSVNKIVSTETFDPGASQATDDQSSEDKSIKEELQEVSEHVEEVTRKIYSGGKNPKLGQEFSAEDKEPSAQQTKTENDIS
jgi:sec-independent protein translocase protein TatB